MICVCLVSASDARKFEFNNLMLLYFSRDCGNGPAGDDRHPVRARDQERHVPHGVPALQGAALQADGHPEEHQPQLRALHHPQPREEGGQDQRSPCAGPAQMQRCPRGDPNLPPGIPQQDSLPRVQTEIRTADTQRHSQGIHGRQEGLRENDRGSRVGPRPLPYWSVQDLLPCWSFGSS